MPGIDPTGPVAPYLQLAEILTRRIKSGQYKPGQRIPTESELVEEFELARSTVRRAVGVLRESGLVHTVPQRGTYVSGTPR
jgi:DNA-binding GntR family transcriptional regulator